MGGVLHKRIQRQDGEDGGQRLRCVRAVQADKPPRVAQRRVVGVGDDDLIAVTHGAQDHKEVG
jgi:hypothetical protein